MFRIFLSAIFVLLTGLAASGQTWGERLFTERSHDFGRVAIGSDTVHRFAMENVFEEDIRILGVHSSCGCTMPGMSKKLLKSQETGVIIARFNTGGQYTREKAATLTVDLETTVKGQTVRDTVLLSVSGYIRPDVVLTPGIAEFGAVREGQAAERTVRLEYAGRSDWALTRIERSNPFVHAKAEEIKRGGGEVVYIITVTLKKDSPAGYVKDVLRLSTNENKLGGGVNEIVLPLQGMVMAPIHAKPSPFMAGILEPGESVAKNIVVRSETPFRIENVTTADKRFRFSYSDTESAIQLISVFFAVEPDDVEPIENSHTAQPLPTGGHLPPHTNAGNALSEPQKLSNEILIKTNLPDQEFVTLEAKALLVNGD